MITPQPIIAAPDILNCTTQDIILDGSASTGIDQLEFQWLDELTNEIGNETTLPITTPGTYTLVVTDLVNGCTATSEVVVEQDLILRLRRQGMEVR